MKIEGFVDIPLNQESWSFFSISCNYSENTAMIYYKVFDGSVNNAKFKTFGLDYPAFILKQNAELTLASVERNPYFDSVSGFIGEMAYIEMSAFYTTELETLWTGYLNSSAYGYRGILLEFPFDLYNKNTSSLQSQGLLKNTYSIEGGYQPLFMDDKNKIGVKFYPNSKINLEGVDFLNNDAIKSMIFYFKLSFEEDLPEEFILAQRGLPGENGFIRISLEKQEGGRSVKIATKGRDGNTSETFTWNSDTIFLPKEIFIFMAGISMAPSGVARLIYLDNTNKVNFDLIDDRYGFDSDA